MSSSSKKPRTKASSSRKRQAGDDEAALAIRSTERAESSTAITRPQQRDRIELDGRPFQYAQIHATSANLNTHLPSDRTSNATRMVSSSNPTDASGCASQPKATGARTSTTAQDQTSAPNHHQALRDLFRTRSHQTHGIPESQRHDSTTKPRSLPPNPQTAQTSAPSSPREVLLEEIDLRSPQDDPEYDIILPHEAQHSSRNAQPDHASKHPKPPTTKKRSSSSPSSSSSLRKGFESDDSGSEESDGELTSWRSYDFVWESEAKHSARNAQADRASKYPELMREREGKGDGGGGGGGEKGKPKGWMGWFS
jgi:hypothetical protein